MCVFKYMHACVNVCVCACVRACVRASLRVRACAYVLLIILHNQDSPYGLCRKGAGTEPHLPGMTVKNEPEKSIASANNVGIRTFGRSIKDAMPQRVRLWALPNYRAVIFLSDQTGFTKSG